MTNLRENFRAPNTPTNTTDSIGPPTECESPINMILKADIKTLRPPGNQIFSLTLTRTIKSQAYKVGDNPLQRLPTPSTLAILRKAS